MYDALHINRNFTARLTARHRSGWWYRLLIVPDRNRDSRPGRPTPADPDSACAESSRFRYLNTRLLSEKSLSLHAKQKYIIFR